jgi:hypothetical protein
MRLGTIAMERDRLLEQGNRLGRPMLQHQRAGKIAHGIEMTRVGDQHPAIAGLGLGRTPQRLKRHAAPDMAVDEVGVELDRLGEMAERRLMLPVLMSQISQQAVRLRDARKLLEDLAIERLGLAQPAGAMMLDRGEKLRRGSGAARGRRGRGRPAHPLVGSG